MGILIHKRYEYKPGRCIRCDSGQRPNSTSLTHHIHCNDVNILLESDIVCNNVGNIAYLDRYKTVFNILLKEPVPEWLLIKYLAEEWSFELMELQDFCSEHSKLPWGFAINIIDAADTLALNKE